MTRETPEVCIVGGGPAGATLARQLALAGHDVCLLERSPFPRHRLGESLAAGILQVLEALGLREAVEQAPFFQRANSFLRWPEPLEAPVPAGEEPFGYVVDRGEFDQFLLKEARAAGVRVLQPVAARRASRLPSRGWLLQVEQEGVEGEVATRFLVDASGRRCWLPGGKLRHGVRTGALYGYWRLPAPERQVPLCTYVEAGQDEWFWGGLLPDRRFGAMVFVDPARYREASPDALYRRLLGTSSLRECMRGELLGVVRATDASAYVAGELADEVSLRVGEAAFAVDPLSAQGVHLAMLSAIQAAAVIHTLLRAPGHSAAALEFYRTHLEEMSSLHGRLAREHHGHVQQFRARPFWKARGPLPSDRPPLRRAIAVSGISADTRLWPAPGGRILKVPCLLGEWIESREALTAPTLERPVSYLGGVELVPLLRLLKGGEPVSQILRLWTSRVGQETGVQVLAWVLRQGVLVPRPEHAA